jgi:hypothetical protein
MRESFLRQADREKQPPEIVVYYNIVEIKILKKNPCPDCTFCQYCSKTRCSMCLPKDCGSKEKKDKKGKTHKPLFRPY